MITTYRIMQRLDRGTWFKSVEDSRGAGVRTLLDSSQRNHWGQYKEVLLREDVQEHLGLVDGCEGAGNAVVGGKVLEEDVPNNLFIPSMAVHHTVNLTSLRLTSKN